MAFRTIRRQSRYAFLSAAIVASLTQFAPAAVKTWDGGSGTWSTTVPTWNTGGNWVQNDSAVFAGTAGTVSLGEAINAAAITLSTNGYIIDLNGFDLTNAGSVTANAADNSTLTITNTSGATKTFVTGQLPGSGPKLSGNMNVTYIGGAWTPAINHDFTGTLSLVGTGTILSAGTTLGTGQIRLAGSNTLSIAPSSGFFRTFTNTIELVSVGAGGISPSGNMINLSGNISGAGEFRSIGTSGALTLSGNNSFTGKLTFVSGGQVVIAASNTAFGVANADPNFNVVDMGSNANTVGFSGGINLSAAKRITGTGSFRPDGLGNYHNFDGDNTFAGNISLGNGQSILVDSGSLALTGIVSGSRAFNKFGEGTLVLANTNTFGNTGNGVFRQLMNVADGTLLLDFSRPSSPDFDIVAATHSSSDVIAAMRGGTLEIKGAAGEANSQWFFTTRADVGDSEMKITLNGATSVGVRMAGFGVRNIGGTVNFALPAGTQTVWTANQTGNGFSTTRANVAGILGGWATTNKTNWATNSGNVLVPYTHTANEQGAAAFDTATHNVDVNATNTAGTITNKTVNSLRFAAGGTLTFSGANTITSGGILVTGSAAGTITGGSITGPVNADLIVLQHNTSAPFTIASDIVNNTATTLTKSGKGILILSGNNSYTGPTYALGGILKLNSATALPGGTGSVGGTSKLVIDGGAIIGLTSDFSRTVGNGALAPTTSVQWFSSGGFAAYGDTRNVNVGAATWNSGGGNDNNNTNDSITQTYTGGFVPTGSRLIFGAPDADGMVNFQGNVNLGNVSIAITRVIEVIDGPANIEARMSGVLSGSTAGFNKTGGGTLELTNLNNYTGDTFVSAGKLLVNGDGSTTGVLNAASRVTVHSGATVGGSGRINGPVSLLSGATISPGASIESLQTGSNTWTGTNTLVLEVSTDGSTGAAGTEWDLLAITGNLNVAGSTGITVDLASMTNATTAGALGTWDESIDHTWSGIVTTTTGITGFNPAVVTVDTTDFQNPFTGTFAVVQNGNNLDLVYTAAAAVPEPASLAVLGIGGLALLTRRRKA
jgi:autotransporter-associated beta strand protein